MAGTFERHRPLSRFDILQQCLDVAVAQFGNVFEDEHQSSNVFGQLWIFATQRFHDGPFDRTFDHVEDLSDAFDTTRVAVLLVDHVAEAKFQSTFQFGNRCRAGAANRCDAPDDFQLFHGIQPREHFRRIG